MITDDEEARREWATSAMSDIEVMMGLLTDIGICLDELSKDGRSKIYKSALKNGAHMLSEKSRRFRILVNDRNHSIRKIMREHEGGV